MILQCGRIAFGVRRVQNWLPAIASSITISTTGLSGQVTLDGSLGTKGSLAGPNYDIPASVGKTAGKNLFHSFGQFDLSQGDVATFSGPGTIQNVLSRVTGGNPSSIDGTIQCSIAGANFYFINPKGVVFGKNASLDVSGSFVATTADYVKLADGTKFVATNPTAADDVMLTAASPVAFGFLGPTVAPITITGGDINQGEPPVTLQVGEEKSIELVGGDIRIVSGTLVAPSGRVTLVSTGSPGEVAAAAEEPLATPDLSPFAHLGTVELSDSSFIDVSGSVRGGKISITAEDITVNNFTLIQADNNGEESSFGIDIAARHSFLLNASVIGAQVHAGGNGGSVSIQAPSITIDGQGGGSAISTGTAGAGRGGDITLEGDTVEILNGSGLDASSFGAGGGGDIRITASSLRVDGLDVGAIVSTTTFDGQPGEIVINAETVDIRNYAGIESQTYGATRGGDIAITAESVQVHRDGRVAVSTFGSGDAGNIELNASTVSLDGGDQIEFTGLAAKSDNLATGRGGDIHLQAESLKVENGAQISVSAEFGTSGQGGSIQIQADAIQINAGAIAATTHGTGNGGDIHIQSQSLLLDSSGGILSDALADSSGNAGSITIEPLAPAGLDVSVRNGSQISASTSGEGSGGTIQLSARSMDLNGADSFFATISATSFGGNAGNVNLELGSLRLQNGARVASEAHAEGAGGNIVIHTSSLAVESSSIVSASTDGLGAGGNIRVTTDTLHLDGSGAFAPTGIAAEAGSSFSDILGAANGGDIVVEANSIEVVNGAAISATTFGDGNGGRIEVKSQTILLDGSADASFITGMIAASGDPSFEVAGSGAAGDITIHSGDLNIKDGASVQCAASGSGVAGNVTVMLADSIHMQSQGSLTVASAASDGGNITLTAGSDIRVKDSSITASAANNGGDITLKAGKLVYFHNSTLTAEATTGNGGNLNIDPPLVVLNHSTINANSADAAGGNIAIVAQEFLGWQSPITASGIQNGTITIQTPDTDVTTSLTMLEDQPIDIESLLQPHCGVKLKNISTFAVRKGGAPVLPTRLVPSFSVSEATP